MNPNAGEPVNPSPPTDPSLASLEGVVAAAKEAAAAQTPEEGQFAAQFGGVVPPGESTPATPSPAEPAPDLMDQALANLGTPPVAEAPALKPEDSTGDSVASLASGIDTVGDLLAKGPQVVENPNSTVEAVAPAEKTPADILKEKIAADINAFLEEVLQKQGVTS